jgi:hypothetical protein
MNPIFLSDITRINIDVSNIIFKYIDYSEDALFKIYNKGKIKYYQTLNITKNLIKALRYGFIGYAIYDTKENIESWYDTTLKYGELIQIYKEFSIEKIESSIFIYLKKFKDHLEPNMFISFNILNGFPDI